MAEICLRVSVLENVVREMKRRQLDNVRLSFIEPDEELSAALSIEGLNSVRPSVAVDVDDLENDSTVESLFNSATVFTNMT